MLRGPNRRLTLHRCQAGKMTTVLHIIESLSLGGAARATVAMAKYSARSGNFHHQIAPLALHKTDPAAVNLALENGVSVLAPQNREELFVLITQADIVSLQWWNSPEMAELLRSALPACRMVAWCHVAGDKAPQIITPTLVNYVDILAACSPYTYLCEAIQSLPVEERLQRTAMAYGATDYSRLADIELKPHSGFNVGYIGTVHFLKMHKDYVRMSAAINIPDAKFIVCGSGGHEDVLHQEANALGMSERFDIRGYVADIRPAIESFDVYGYPLCEDTYAASELNLQEVMYAGVPPVVFPYGGVSLLLVNDFTGLIVRSSCEYKEAVEHLYHSPEERKRIGENAKQYARQIFGAENAALKMNSVYDRLMRQAKRSRLWGIDNSKTIIESDAALAKAGNSQATGCDYFIESLGAVAQGDFVTSRTAQDVAEAFKAEEHIAHCSELMFSSGIVQYLRYYPKDPWLLLWAGVARLQRGDTLEALADLAESAANGNTHWRVYWYLAQAAKACGMQDVARNALSHVISLAPEFEEARQLLGSLAG